MSLAIALLALGAGACAVPAEEASTQAALPYAAFDSRSGPYGWRALSASGCVDAAIALLQRYRDANPTRLGADEARELAFHVGQALAMAGREPESIASFEAAQGADATPEWRTYVEATLAFLRRDAAALAQARSRYAALAPGSMRLRIIDGFVACPDAGYARAAHCAM